MAGRFRRHRGRPSDILPAPVPAGRARNAMGVMRRGLLWASQNEALRTRLPRYRFVRRAVRKFMPGDTIEDALVAAKSFAAQGLPTSLTQLGENVTTADDADAVARH